jgi:hypothetical protein
MALASIHTAMPSVIFGCRRGIRNEACVPAAGLLLSQTALWVDVVLLDGIEESRLDRGEILAADSVE